MLKPTKGNNWNTFYTLATVCHLNPSTYNLIYNNNKYTIALRCIWVNTLNVFPFMQFIVDGKWADWSNWGQCSVTCGTGNQQRTRSCTNPATEHGGLDCVGNSSETDKSCVLDPCPSE